MGNELRTLNTQNKLTLRAGRISECRDSWLGYFGIASIKTTLTQWDEWLSRRYRCNIWKQWKKPKKREKNLIQLGIPEWQTCAVSNRRDKV